jgi:hypothetical protein
LTGRVIDSENLEESTNTVNLTIEENVTEVEVSYETPAPTAVETNVSHGKEVVISGPDEVHYENVTAFAFLDGDYDLGDISLFWASENVSSDFEAYDTNENGLVDYIEWLFRIFLIKHIFF